MYSASFALLLLFLAVLTCIYFGYRRLEGERSARFKDRDVLDLDDWILDQLGETYATDSELIRQLLEIIASYIKCKPTQLRANDRFDRELALPTTFHIDETVNCVEEEVADLVWQSTGRDLPFTPEELDTTDIGSIIRQVCSSVHLR